MTLGPANEANELDTLLLLGQFGAGRAGPLRPVEVKVVGSLTLAGPAGEIQARGVTYSNQADMDYEVDRLENLNAEHRTTAGGGFAACVLPAVGGGRL